MKKFLNHIDDNYARYTLLFSISTIILMVITAPSATGYFNRDNNQNGSQELIQDPKGGFWESLTTTDITLIVLTTVFLFLAAYFFYRLKQKKKLAAHIFEFGQPYYKRTKDLVSENLRKENLVVPIRYTNVTTINDLIDAATKIYYPKADSHSIEKTVVKSRRKAYAKKYASPSNNDEKVKGIDIYNFWEDHMYAVLRILGIEDLSQLRILDVGIGNAHTYSDRFKSANSYIGLDLSHDALEKAKEKLPNIRTKVGDAEDLNCIDNNSIDLYLSIRTFQSTLFNRRRALHEAKRVLSPGGKIVISIPILYYLSGKKKFVRGLCDAYENYSMKFAYKVSNGIKDYLEMLNFSNIGVYEKSPYELFIYGQIDE